MPAPQAEVGTTPASTGVMPEPTLFCNTCFTRGGGWLNECTEENQISLIRALSGLGVQAVITDAGWFRGGWPEGAGRGGMPGGGGGTEPHRRRMRSIRPRRVGEA